MMGEGLGRENSVLGFGIQTPNLQFLTQFSVSALWYIQKIFCQEMSFQGALQEDG